MKKQTLLTGAAVIAALPLVALVPGCGGGNGGIFTPTSTPTNTAIPTGTQSTATPTSTSATATPVPSATVTNTPKATNTPKPTATVTNTPKPTSTASPLPNLVNVTFTAQNGAVFGTNPYVSDNPSAEKQGTNGDLTIYSTSGVRYLTLKLRSLGPVKDGQVFALNGIGSWLVASGPPANDPTNEYDSYGGVGFSSGTATAQRTGNVATFTLKNVVLSHASGSASANAKLTFNGIFRVTLPPDAR